MEEERLWEPRVWKPVGPLVSLGSSPKRLSNIQLAFIDHVCRPQPDTSVSSQNYQTSYSSLITNLSLLVKKNQKLVEEKTNPLRPTNTTSFRIVEPLLAQWHPGLSKPSLSPFWAPSPRLSATWFVYQLLRCPVITKPFPSNHLK